MRRLRPGAIFVAMALFDVRTRFAACGGSRPTHAFTLTLGSAATRHIRADTGQTRGCARWLWCADHCSHGLCQDHLDPVVRTADHFEHVQCLDVEFTYGVCGCDARKLAHTCVRETSHTLDTCVRETSHTLDVGGVLFGRAIACNKLRCVQDLCASPKGGPRRARGERARPGCGCPTVGGP